MVATVSTAPTFSVTSRQIVSEGTYSFNNNGLLHAGFDVAPDGKHLLLEKPTNAVPQIVVVHDWKYELRARMAPAGKK